MSLSSYNILCRKLYDEEQGVAFALANGLIKTSSRTCNCGQALALSADPCQKLGLTFRCTKSRSICGKRYSILHGTWFSNSNLPIQDQILMIYCYCMELKSSQIIAMFNFASCHTVADWQNYFKDVCTIYMDEVGSEKIGGHGLTVEIDETKIFKRKSHSGRLSGEQASGDWAFGGICRETKETFFCIVPDRTEATLISKLVENVNAGSIIMSDMWRSYSNISKYGFTHSKVNHSKNFLNPDDPTVHTQTIERAWRGLKENIPKASRYEERFKYLIAYSFKRYVKWYGMNANDRFALLISLIARFY